MKYVTIPVIKINQKIGSFYIGKIKPKNLFIMSNDSLSRMKNAEKGIQRDKSPEKIKEIREYLKKKDSTFPNSIIIAVQKNSAEFDNPDYILNENETELKIKLEDSVVNILDGQHRLAGFDQNEEDFELPLSIFLDLDLGRQAEIFAQINGNQKKVPLDLVYELFGMTENRSYEKSSYNIVKHLNEEEDSAWYKNIKTLAEKGDLAQGSMSKYIHKNLIYENKVLNKLYIEDRDTDIKNIIKNYFNAVKNTFPGEWNKGNILTKTTGFNGFSVFMIDLIKLAKEKDVELSVQYFEDFLNKTKNNFEEFNSDNYESGVKGQNKIRDILRSGLSEDDKKLLKIK